MANLHAILATSLHPYGARTPAVHDLDGAYGAVEALVELPDGDVVAGGLFQNAGGVPAIAIARWDGAAWSSLDAGLRNTNGSPATAFGLARLPGDDLVVVGILALAGGHVANSVARLTTTCPASATPIGAGCPSSGGAKTLAATALPWIGDTARVVGTDLPTSSLVAMVGGVALLTLPFTLANAFPQALPGCDLLVTPDVCPWIGWGSLRTIPHVRAKHGASGALAFKTLANRDGTTAVVMTKAVLMERLCALVPKPRKHLAPDLTKASPRTRAAPRHRHRDFGTWDAGDSPSEPCSTMAHTSASTKAAQPHRGKHLLVILATIPRRAPAGR